MVNNGHIPAAQNGRPSPAVPVVAARSTQQAVRPSTVSGLLRRFGIPGVQSHSSYHSGRFYILVRMRVIMPHRAVIIWPVDAEVGLRLKSFSVRFMVGKVTLCVYCGAELSVSLLRPSTPPVSPLTVTTPRNTTCDEAHYVDSCPWSQTEGPLANQQIPGHLWTSEVHTLLKTALKLKVP